MWLTFILLISDFCHCITSAFRRRTVVSVFLSRRPISGGPRETRLAAAQFLAEARLKAAPCQAECWQLFSAPSKFYGQAERAISTGKLHASLRFHLQPINQVVFLGPSYPLRVGRSHLEECFPLICIQRLSQPNFATERCHWHDSSNTRGSSIPVLSY